MTGKWFQSDPNRSPDSDFESGELHHLRVGNEGRLLDFRRTPVRINDVSFETGLATVEIMAFEDKGALWDLPFEDVKKYQFKKESPRCTREEMDRILDAVSRLDRIETVSCTAAKSAETLQTLGMERKQASDWLSKHSRFLQSGNRLPEGEPEGAPLLYEDIKTYMGERDFLDLEALFTRQYVSNMNNEFVKAHRIAVSHLGLATYKGKAIRDSSQSSGEFDFERRGKHILARMGWVQALFRHLGREAFVLYRMESCEGNLRPRRKDNVFISASFRMDIVQEMSGWADSSRSVALYRQTVPIERIVMTYLETETMNHPFREAEAVLLADPANEVF